MSGALGDPAGIWPLIATLMGGYLLGSIPFGLLLTRLAGMGDIRTIGSGNIGATNVLRTGNKALAALTLLLDGGKGVLAVLLAFHWWGRDAAAFGGAAAVIGHLFPVWLRFKGGKGVATTFGVLIAIAWPVGLAAMATWLAVAALFRISSLAAILAIAASPIYAWLWSDTRCVELTIVLAILVLVKHHANIRRLLKGEEPRIGASA